MWLPICRAMQRYCEPYFSCLLGWIAYRGCLSSTSEKISREDLIRNRIQLVEALCLIFKDYSANPDVYEFDIVCENEVPLNPEVIPIDGKNYVEKGDMDAFNNAKRFITDKTLFNKAGVYFQNNLLKALAGWNADILKTSNKESRKSITNAVEKLFRIPQEAGRAKIVFRQISDASSSGTVETEIVTIQVPLPAEQPFKDFELQPLCKEASALIDLILTRDPKDFNRSFPPISPPQSRAKAANTAIKATPASKIKTVKKILDKASKAVDNKKNQFDEETDEIAWTEIHDSVGTAVAAYFPPPKKPEEYLTSQIFKGSITKYAPESFLDANDHLYHIVWEDGDEQDYDEDDFVSGRNLYDRLKEGWITEHESVGTRVAAKFPSGTRKKLFTGIIVRYCPATSDEEGDQLYHIIWEDWDEQDYDESELVTGKALYAELDKSGGGGGGGVSSAPKSAEKKKTSSSTSDSGSVSPTTASERKKRRGRPSLSDDRGSKSSTAASRVSQRNSRRTSTGSDSGSIMAASNSPSPKKKSKEVVYIPPERVSDRKSKKIVNNDYVSSVFVESPPPSKPEPEPVKAPEPEPEPEPIPWTTDHEFIGSRVAQYFPVFQKTYVGKIIKYAPPSTEDAADQLYHVEWEDGDAADYDEADYQRGLLALKDLIPQHSLLGSASTSQSGEQQSSEYVHQPSPAVSGTSSRKKRKRASDPSLKTSRRNVEVVDLVDGNTKTTNNKVNNASSSVSERIWTVDHSTVGMKVAAFFISPEAQEKVRGRKKTKQVEELSRKKVKTRPFIGKVVRYCLPSVSGADDQLYQILWEDGDQEDYNENDFLEGLALINKLIPLADDSNDMQSESGESLASMQVQEPEVDGASASQIISAPVELPIIPADVAGTMQVQDSEAVPIDEASASQTSATVELPFIPADVAASTEPVLPPPVAEETTVSEENEAMDVVIEGINEVPEERDQLLEGEGDGKVAEVVLEEKSQLIEEGGKVAEEEEVKVLEEVSQVFEKVEDNKVAVEEVQALEEVVPVLEEENRNTDQKLDDDNGQGVTLGTEAAAAVAVGEDSASIDNLIDNLLVGENEELDIGLDNTEELAGEAP